jgi:hypothetical protein
MSPRLLRYFGRPRLNPAGNPLRPRPTEDRIYYQSSSFGRERPIYTAIRRFLTPQLDALTFHMWTRL